jgi:hypothetical protein
MCHGPLQQQNANNAAVSRRCEKTRPLQTQNKSIDQDVACHGDMLLNHEAVLPHAVSASMWSGRGRNDLRSPSGCSNSTKAVLAMMPRQMNAHQLQGARPPPCSGHDHQPSCLLSPLSTACIPVTDHLHHLRDDRHRHTP